MHALTHSRTHSRIHPPTYFNEQRRSEYDAQEWSFLSRQAVRGADGVHGQAGLLEPAGFVNLSDIPDVKRGSFSQPSGAPRFTHWAGTNVDHAYLHTEVADTDNRRRVTADAVHTLPILLSNHLPTVIDLNIHL